MQKRRIAILGSTGSIGRQALDVIRQHGDLFEVELLTANNSSELLIEQAIEFCPNSVVICNETKYNEVADALQPHYIKVFAGMQSVCDLAGSDTVDIVLTSMVGFSGLSSTIAAIKAGKTIALANKETLVTGGDIVNAKAREKGVKILPVDSEHSAIFQSLQGSPQKSLRKILLTASGGPFYGKTREELENVTVKEALNHPNWSMGAKITIDSATLMNKGLEVIEAVHLFGLPAKDIEVLVHRQSIVHSGVEFSDGAVIAQLGTPDMRLPIQYALTYPERSDYAFEHLSLSEIGTLTFEKPDTDTFRCLPLCIKAITEGGLKPTAVNGANEQAVKLFLEGKIKFLQIAELVEKALLSAHNKKEFTLEDILETDKLARECVLNKL